MKLKYSFKLSILKLFIYDVLIFINTMLESLYSENNNISFLVRLFRYLSIILLFLTILLMKKYSKKHILIAGSILFCCIINYILKDGSIGLILTLLIFLSCKDLPSDKIIKHTVISVSFSYGFVIISSLCGIIDNMKLVRYLSIGVWQGKFERQALGFQFPNQIPLMYLYITAVIILGLQKNFRFFNMVILMIPNIIIYFFCNARTPFILVIFMLLSCLLFNKYKGKSICMFPFILTLVSFLGSFILSIGYQNFKISKTLDLLLNSRLSSAYVTIKYYGITLFGSGVDAGTKSSGIRNNFWDGFIANVDNGYLIFLLQYGLILTLILLLILLAFSFKIYKNGNVYFALVFSIVIIANIIDANLVSFRIWPILLIFANNYQPDRQAIIYNIFHIRFTSKKKKYN